MLTIVEKSLRFNQKLGKGLLQVMNENHNSITMPQRPLSKIIGSTVKTGIIKSNLIPMFAGLTLSLFTYDKNLVEVYPNIIYAFIGTALVIGAAGAFNNLYDRDIDAIMKRTQNRPTVTGEISGKTVLWLSILMTVLGVGILTLANPLTGLLGFLGVFFYVGPYTMWSKRRTVYNTEIGSISGAMPPLIGWAAIHPDITHPAIIGLFVVSIIWQMPHFYAIAIKNHAEYEAASVPMLPVVKGVKRTILQTNIYLLILIASSFLFGTLSLGLMLVSLIMSIGWLVVSIYNTKKMDGKNWAKNMFIYSLIYMTVIFSTVIIYSLIGIFFL